MLRTVAKIGLFVVLMSVAASANTIGFDTLNAHAGLWQITAYASVWPGFANTTSGAAFASGTDSISPSSNGYASGTYVGGMNRTNFLFDGFWTASYTFYLPAEAYNVSLAFQQLMGDDRVVLQLNGTTIGRAALDPAAAGKMALTDSQVAHEQPLAFNVGTSGTVSTASLFNIGGTNTLTLIVNNTGLNAAHAWDATLPTSAFPYRVSLDSTDRTWALVSGYADFMTPEPGSLSLLLLGAAPLAWCYFRKRR
jgi:hypothetical protein